MQGVIATDGYSMAQRREGASAYTCAGETVTMIGIGIFFSILGLGYLAGLLFNLYVYALPTIVGGIAGFAAYHSGAGGVGAFIVGFVVGVLTLVGGWTAIKTARSPAIRIAVMLLFVIPAAWAGYSVTLDFVR